MLGALTTEEVLELHARGDEVSHYRDVEALVTAIKLNGGQALMVTVPDDKAGSDIRSRKQTRGKNLKHSYYYYSMLEESSEELTWQRVRKTLFGTSERPGRPAAVAGPATWQRLQPNGVPAPNGGKPLSKAEARLHQSASRMSSMAIGRLKQAQGFGSEVELALRMLQPGSLHKLLGTDLASELAKHADKDEGMWEIISGLDGDVRRLVGELRELEARRAAGEEEPEAAVEAEAAVDARDAAPQAAPPAELLQPTVVPARAAREAAAARAELQKGAARDSGSVVNKARAVNANLVAEAEARLKVAKSPQQLEAIRGFRQRNALGDEVELALRMLQPANLLRFLQGVQGLQVQLGAARDKAALVMSRLSLLDPEVESLVRSLQHLDKATEEADTAEDAEDAESELAEAMATVHRRMDAYRSVGSWKAIADFKTAAGFGDAAELALRILPQLQMRRLMLQKHQLLGALAELPCQLSKDEHILDIVAKVDPLVATLVRRLTAADEVAPTLTVAAPAAQRVAPGAAAAGPGPQGPRLVLPPGAPRPRAGWRPCGAGGDANARSRSPPRLASRLPYL